MELSLIGRIQGFLECISTYIYICRSPALPGTAGEVVVPRILPCQGSQVSKDQVWWWKSQPELRQIEAQARSCVGWQDSLIPKPTTRDDTLSIDLQPGRIGSSMEQHAQIASPMASHQSSCSWLNHFLLDFVSFLLLLTSALLCQISLWETPSLLAK